MTVRVAVHVYQPLVPSVLLQRKPVNEASQGSIVGANPSYLVIGGLVFTTLTKEYINSEFNSRDMGDFDRWTNEYELLSMINKPKTALEEEVPILTQIIAHSCNIGYDNYSNIQLKKFNGQEVKNLRDLKAKIEAVRVSTDEASKYLVFEFSNTRVIILDSKKAFDSETEVCEIILPSL